MTCERQFCTGFEFFMGAWIGYKIIQYFISILVHWPFARLSIFFEWLGVSVYSIPLSFYRRRSFYRIRADIRGRFGTLLVQRFSVGKIEKKLQSAGLSHIKFSDVAPFWCTMVFKA
jgi:hypothetical protein